MRPVNKGIAPKAYADYREAQPDLVAAIDRFCSYCGRFIASGIHVEHKRPKDFYPDEELLWANFLLSCHNCNSSKQSRQLRLNDYVWPDSDNTLRAFKHSKGGLVRVNRRLPKRLRRKASRTLFMLGLDKVPGAFRQPTDRDYRWRDRFEEWNKALVLRSQLQEHDTPRQRGAIIVSANRGIFAIWMEVFADYADIRTGLISSFRGTDATSFDNSGNAVPRPGGQL